MGPWSPGPRRRRCVRGTSSVLRAVPSTGGRVRSGGPKPRACRTGGRAAARPRIQDPCRRSVRRHGREPNRARAASPSRGPSRAPKPGPAGKASRWWHLHWTNPLLPVVTALGAAAVTAAAFIGVQVFRAAAPAVAASFNLHAQPGQSGSATATARARLWRLGNPAHRQGPQQARPGPVLRVLVCGPGQPARPAGTDHGRHVRRQQRHVHHVDRRRPGQVQDHADHGRAARQRQPARQGHPQRHRPAQLIRRPGVLCLRAEFCRAVCAPKSLPVERDPAAFRGRSSATPL